MSNAEKKDIRFMESFHRKGMLEFAINLFGENITSKKMADESLNVLDCLEYSMPKTSIPVTSQTKYLNLIKKVRDNVNKKALTF